MTVRLRPCETLADGRGPWWAARLEELSQRELALLAYVTSGHVPHEVRFNLALVEAERARLLVDATAD
jgi:hypothetical protein